MVIRSDFDKTLWFILKYDTKIRNDIFDFIKNIPVDLLERIHQELDKCPVGDEKYPFVRITKAFRNDENDTYFYDISLNGCQIIINLSIWKYNDDSYHEVRQITLYPLTMDDIKNIEPEYPIYIGDYYHTISKRSFLLNTVICNGNDRGYELIDSYGDYITIQDVDGKLCKNINITIMPSEINIEDFKDKRIISRLVRKRN